MTRRRIGLFGGTFDPLHLGHLVVGEVVRDALGLDAMRFVVANDPWQKSPTRSITPADRRVEMVAAALEGIDGLEVCTAEIELGGPSRTITTIDFLSEREPDVDWMVVIGSDAAAGLDTWHDAARLRERAEFVVVDRPGDQPAPPPGWRWQRVDVPGIEISSTLIRERVASGATVRFLVPDPVMHLLDRWALYRPTR